MKVTVVSSRDIAASGGILSAEYWCTRQEDPVTGDPETYRVWVARGKAERARGSFERARERLAKAEQALAAERARAACER